ncbi:phosphoglycerate kinase [candidate division CSSED10-310 bacterium]|uniref:Phosphoglycerate kinase n=1 Tax=candidate division CSSED10-310 bacterium TaxID=2855610 RepID=A0ABV6Z102_UNCC1
MIDTEIQKKFYNKLNIDEIDVAGKKVFVRTDYDVPLDDENNIKDDALIRASLETISYLIDNNAKIVLASHLGCPKGKFNPALSLKPVARRLGELLHRNIPLLPDCIGTHVSQYINNLGEGEVILLENLRFHPGEKKDMDPFSAALNHGYDVYVNEAFGSCHRDHASISSLPKHIPLAVTGFHVKKEMNIFLQIMTDPQRPFVALLGGAKVSEKIGLIQKLLEKVDSLLIGGGMAYTFLKAIKFDVGNSLVEGEYLDIALELLNEAQDLGVEFLLPVDNIVARKTVDEVKTSTVRNENIPSSWMALDIGPETTRIYTEKIQNARTVFWNGPVGVFEKELFCGGTQSIAQTIAESEAASIVGGGDTVLAINVFSLVDKMTHISTGNKASLQFLEGKILPGIAVLTDKS